MKYLLISFIFLVGCPSKNAAVKSDQSTGTLDAAKDPALGAGVSGASIIPATPASSTPAGSTATPLTPAGSTATPITPVITNPATSYVPTESGYTVTESGITLYVDTKKLDNVNIKLPSDKKFIAVKINLDKDAIKKALNAQQAVDANGNKVQTSFKPSIVSMKMPTSYVNIGTKRQTDQPPSDQGTVVVNNGDIIGTETVNASVAYGPGCCPVVQISCNTLKGKTEDCALGKNASLNALATSATKSYLNYYIAQARADDPQAQYAFPCEQK